MVLSIVGSVCGTLVSAAFGASAELKLVGAALGAAIPPLVAATGPYRSLRAATGVLIAAGALATTYGGFTLSDYATAQSRSTFPLPAALPSTSPTSAWAKTADHPDAECEEGLCILVTPRTLRCGPDSCDRTVEIHNVGTEQLRTTYFEITGGLAGSVSFNPTCQNREVDVGEPCRVEVTFTPAVVGTGELVIHQNLEGPASRVALIAEDDPQPPSVTPDVVALGATECWVDVADGAPTLSVVAHVEMRSAAEVESSVEATLSTSGGLRGSSAGLLTSGSHELVVRLTLSESELGQAHDAELEVDPDDEIDESDESNNTTSFVVDVGSRDESGLVSCSV